MLIAKTMLKIDPSVANESARMIPRSPALSTESTNEASKNLVIWIAWKADRRDPCGGLEKQDWQALNGENKDV